MFKLRMQIQLVELSDFANRGTRLRAPPPSILSMPRPGFLEAFPGSVG